MNIFDAPQNTSQQMADHLPDGRSYGKKNVEDSNTRKLIESLAVAHNNVQHTIQLLSEEFDINQTIDLLVDLERSVGLPDICLESGGSTIEERRQAVIDRLKKDPIVTLQDFQNFVDTLLPGFGVIFIPGSEYYTFELGFEVDFLGGVNERFVLVATVPLSELTFEYEFEIQFEGGVNTDQLECIINNIIPSNVILIIEFVG